MPKIHFIIDPIESRIGQRWPYEQRKIEDLCQDFEIHMVRGKNHAEHLALEACRKSAELIVCVGSDAALYEISNAIFSHGEKAPALTIYPGLQKGGFSKSLNWRESFIDFLDAFLKGEAQEFFADLGVIRFTGEYGQKIERVFLSSFGFGFSSYLLNRLGKQLSRRMTRMDYVKILARSLPLYRLPRLKLEVDGIEYPSTPILTGILQNSPIYAESFRFSPEAQINDGSFEFIRVDKAPWPKYLLAAIPFVSGKTSSFRFISRQKVKKLKVDGFHQNRLVRIDADGECRGFLPAEVEIREKGLRVLR